MPRNADIKTAFLRNVEIININSQVVNTSDFVKELEKINHHFTRGQANEWIAYYQPSWMEFADEGNDLKRFSLMNMGYTR